GAALAAPRRDALLAAAREVARAHPLHATSGATAPHDDVVVVRALADRVEPAMALLLAIWQRWRRVAWRLDAVPPRVWAT
nr:urease accessory protein UreD [Caldimonas sp.]